MRTGRARVLVQVEPAMCSQGGGVGAAAQARGSPFCDDALLRRMLSGRSREEQQAEAHEDGCKHKEERIP